MIYNDFKELWGHIRQIKQYVLELNLEELQKYKKLYYNQPISKWKLNLMWDYIFDYKSYNEIRSIFENSRLI